MPDDEKVKIMELLSKMKAHITDTTVQREGFDDLCVLAYNSAENQKFISTAGGLCLIARSMKEHFSNATVQASGCLALANMSHDYSVNDQMIAIEGGIGAVLAAMKAHPEDPQVQRCACMAIRNLTYQCSENRALIALADGISLILFAMKVHIVEPEVQAEACAALGNLAVNSENKVKIVEAGGIMACNTAYALFQKDENVKKIASGAFLRLQFVHKSSKIENPEEGEEFELLYGPHLP